MIPSLIKSCVLILNLNHNKAFLRSSNKQKSTQIFEWSKLFAKNFSSSSIRADYLFLMSLSSFDIIKEKSWAYQCMYMFFRGFESMLSMSYWAILRISRSHRRHEDRIWQFSRDEQISCFHSICSNFVSHKILIWLNS